jgi:23S rRNA (uridine2552-2'-O)-methyltransferase
MTQRKLHDRFFLQAKAEGYLARSAYKLKEIQERKRIIRKGGRVLDLGCAPGAWLQVALELVGPKGVVVGIDLSELPPHVLEELGPNVRVKQADVYTIDPAELVAVAGGRFDAVLSDMAPSTSGSGDDYPSERLCRRVLEMLPTALKIGGNLTMKIFEGELYPALVRDTGKMFEKVKGFKPEASREMSREIYIVAHGYLGGVGTAGGGKAPSYTPA